MLQYDRSLLLRLIYLRNLLLKEDAATTRQLVDVASSTPSRTPVLSAPSDYLPTFTSIDCL